MTVLNRIQFLTLLILLLFTQQTVANVLAKVDRKTAYEGESLTLSIRADNLAGMNKPDFSPLEKDFDLSGTSQSSSISIINGRSTASQTWSVRLHPRKIGEIEIPALTVGQFRTQPITIEIKPVPVQSGAPKQGQPLFITMEVDSNAGHFYVQQHIPLVVKLYYKHELKQGHIIDPKLENASLEKLGDDTSYSTQYNGQNYNVVERRYSLLVEKSGQLTIPAVSFQGYMHKPQPYSSQQGYDPFASFILRSPLMNQGQPVSIRSEPVKLNIESHPPEFDGPQWLPAEDLQLEDSWTSNPPVFKVGEPVSRTITLLAKGLVASQIKPLELPLISSFRRYAEPAETETRTDGQTVYGVSKRTFTYIPAYAGEQKIPELEIKWWNVITEKQEITRLPAWEIRVEDAPGVQQTPAPALQSTTTGAVITQSDNEEKDNTTPDQPSLEAIDTEKIKSYLFEYRYWISGLILLLIVLYFMRSSGKTAARSKSPATGSVPPSPAVNEGTDKTRILESLHQGCNNNDAPQVARSLLELARITWPENPPMSIGALANNISEGKQALLDMDRHLYSSGKDQWDSKEVCRIFKYGFQRKPSEKKQETALKPLYPQ